MNRLSLGLLAAFSLLPCFPALASEAELKTLREELAQMKNLYQQRIDALEQRLSQIAAPPESRAASAHAQLRPPSGKATSFNPDVSLILQGALTKTERPPATWTIQGFVPGGEADEIGPPRRRGLSLRETELVFTANVDPNWRALVNLALTPTNAIAVEEAYVQSLALGQGFTLKGGRFLSGIGYQNEHHPHSWDFADAPLAYTAFLGNKLTAEGLQLKWLAPTSSFLELGLEAGRDNAFPGSNRNKGGSALATVFAHVGDDWGRASSWRAGLSVLAAHPQDRAFAQTDTTGNANTVEISGENRTYIADFVWKWAPNGNPKEQNLKLQAEYFRRTESGTLSCRDSASPAAGGSCFPALSSTYHSTQSGYYAQAIYQFRPEWRVGYRFDSLNSGATSIGLVDTGRLASAALPQFAAWKPRRDTIMVDYATSEFARWRFQFANDASRGTGQSDKQFWLQYVISIGSHGAHKF